MSETEIMQAKSSKSPALLIGLVAVVAVLGYFLMMRQPSSETTMTASPIVAEVETATASASPSPSAVGSPVATATGSVMSKTDSGVKEIKIVGDKFRFNPDKMTVKKGEKVRVVLTSNDMPHDFVIDELKIKSNLAQKGESVTVEFTADKVGSYEYYCSYGSHKANGMVGTMTVTE